MQFLLIRKYFLLGQIMEAVSAIKCTPQKMITSASVLAAAWESPRESPTKSAISCMCGI